jgi:hypothetical protein
MELVAASGDPSAVPARRQHHGTGVKQRRIEHAPRVRLGIRLDQVIPERTGITVDCRVAAVIPSDAMNLIFIDRI